jgi:hypothetical protein
MRPDGAPPPGATARDLTRRGREAEVEAAFRRVLAAGWPLDHVEIVGLTGEAATLVWEKAQRHAWPVTVEGGIPVTRTRPARALLGFLGWLEEGFRASALRHLLQSGT